MSATCSPPPPAIRAASFDTAPETPARTGIDIDIPDFRHLQLEHLVLDFNGTLAQDGLLLPGVASRLRQLAELVQIHVVTADTCGNAEHELRGLPVTLTLLPPESQIKAKRFYALRLGSDKVAAIGNGRNDLQLLATASLGILVLQREGAFGGCFASSAVVTTSVLDALDLLINPRRLVATLRG